jgi:hypothetical protein
MNYHSSVGVSFHDDFVALVFIAGDFHSPIVEIHNRPNIDALIVHRVSMLFLTHRETSLHFDKVGALVAEPIPTKGNEGLVARMANRN